MSQQKRITYLESVNAALKWSNSRLRQLFSDALDEVEESEKRINQLMDLINKSVGGK